MSEALPIAAPIARRRLSPKVRIALLVAVIVLLGAIAHGTGLTEAVTRERVQELAASWGAPGLAVYVIAFSVGEIFQLPGVIFVVAAIAAYGPWLGTAAAYLGMLSASITVFLFGRLVAGRALAEVEHPRVRALMARVDRAPIATVVFLRAVLFVLPGIGYACALSAIRFRDYVTGCAIGLVVPSVIAAVIGEWALSFLT
jgi:uncharacterized membrane protein YdjX (TVP38/TMEM64 family)